MPIHTTNHQMCIAAVGGEGGDTKQIKSDKACKLKLTTHSMSLEERGELRVLRGHMWANECSTASYTLYSPHAKAMLLNWSLVLSPLLQLFIS